MKVDVANVVDNSNIIAKTIRINVITFSVNTSSLNKVLEIKE